MNYEFELSFEGAQSDKHLIDFYDVSVALAGFQRSLALTTHLVLNNEVITQAPSLRNAVISAKPPQEGSWKTIAVVGMVGTGAFNVLGSERDSVMGNMVASAYDYVISETLGFNVDFDKTLVKQYQEVHKGKEPNFVDPITRLDSIVEKCENSIKVMHRPIVESGTAEKATVVTKISGAPRILGRQLDGETYQYLQATIKNENSEAFVGKISSYNANTFKGRVYVPLFGRPLPFLLADDARSNFIAGRLAENLALNAQTSFRNDTTITLWGHRLQSKSGRVKSLLVTGVEAQSR